MYWSNNEHTHTHTRREIFIFPFLFQYFFHSTLYYRYQCECISICALLLLFYLIFFLFLFFCDYKLSYSILLHAHFIFVAKNSISFEKNNFFLCFFFLNKILNCIAYLNTHTTMYWISTYSERQKKLYVKTKILAIIKINFYYVRVSEKILQYRIEIFSNFFWFQFKKKLAMKQFWNKYNGNIVLQIWTFFVQLRWLPVFPKALWALKTNLDPSYQVFNKKGRWNS